MIFLHQREMIGGGPPPEEWTHGKGSSMQADHIPGKRRRASAAASRNRRRQSAKLSPRPIKDRLEKPPTRPQKESTRFSCGRHSPTPERERLFRWRNGTRRAGHPINHPPASAPRTFQEAKADRTSHHMESNFFARANDRPAIPSSSPATIPRHSLVNSVAGRRAIPSRSGILRQAVRAEVSAMRCGRRWSKDGVDVQVSIRG